MRDERKKQAMYMYINPVFPLKGGRGNTCKSERSKQCLNPHPLWPHPLATPTGHMYCRNEKGETPVHCAAYNSTDSGALMEYLLSICKDNSVLDTHEILSQRENVAHVS